MEKPIKTTAERLHTALKMRDIKPVELHAKTGISKPSISQYMSGLVKPKQDRIYLMARALNVDDIWLMGYNVPMERKEPFRSSPSILLHAKNIVPMNTEHVPLLEHIAAGKPILAKENINGYENLAGGVHADFCMEMRGDSMIQANIHSGDIVFICQQNKVEDGEIAAVLIDASATLKRFYRHDEAIELRPENPRYKSMYFTDGNCDRFKILGKAVALQTLVK